jgi:diaminopimelate epimerase
MAVRFFKMSGAGNDFVALDNRDDRLPPDTERSRWFRRLCARGEGVGADGVLLLENTDEAHVRMRYHNADGGEASMCGNGLRCLARLAHHLRAAPREMTVLTAAGLHHAKILDETAVRVTITDPTLVEQSVPLLVPPSPRNSVAGDAEEEGDTIYTATVVHPGVPHIAIDASAWPTPLESIDVAGLGYTLRHHRALAPAGANVNFFRRDAEGGIRMRTYERGVEAETLACGTGAVTVAIAVALRHGQGPPIRIVTHSGHTLIVGFRREGDSFTDVTLEGPAIITFTGELTAHILPDSPFPRGEGGQGG